MSQLSVFLGFLAVASWVSTFVLVREAHKTPRIGALTERAVIAVVVSMLATAGVVIVWNTDTGFALFAADAARVAFRVGIAVLLCLPIYWLVLYLTGRLGDGT